MITKKIKVEFSNNFRSKFSEEMGSENLLQIENATKNVLKKIQESERKSGLMLGKIQSRKTLNYLSLIAHGFGQGYMICLVLTPDNVSTTDQTKKRIEKCFEKEQQESTAINRCIRGIRSKIPLHAYISVTATPFANLLLNEKDEMSPELVEPIYPGKPYKGKKYYGLSEIWEKGSKIYQKIVRKVTESEVKYLLDEKNNFLPSSLENAIIFFLSVASYLDY
ncbi:MAG: hypothetical protein I3273_05930 [Candidatus Moeniiplasma glomeromycotorum]|nr:hypothetical protein [Candidatus Moeniiplasma glomeromycotorum]MCE8168067.1 hypothetical protein [Candidatus Moeniiplasma glomeromycotorum]MCE8169624.1 hypothetical protein [Candidatus Moeniiplasma glomeromycotorum]